MGHLTIRGCFTKAKKPQNSWYILTYEPSTGFRCHAHSFLTHSVFSSMHFSPMLHIMRLLICSISKARNMSQTRPFPWAVKINMEPRKTRPTLSITKGWTPKDGQHSVATTCQVEQDWPTPNIITLLSFKNFHKCKRYIYSIISPEPIILVYPHSFTQHTKVCIYIYQEVQVFWDVMLSLCKQ